MLPRSQHSVAVSLARIIAATRDIIHYTARFVNTFFQKNSDFFCAAEPRPTRRESPLPSGAVRAFSALVYREPESQRAGKIRFYCGDLRLCCAFLLGCLAFGSRPALRFYWDVWRLVHACCLPHSAKQDGLRYVAFLFRRGSGSPVLRSRIVSAIIGLCRFTLSLRVSLWRSRRRTKGRGERSRRRGVGAFCASILAL